MAGVIWTEQETRLAMRLYFMLPFGKLHSRNPDIMALAARIGRTASAVSMKLVNFASLDPALTARGRRGLGNCSRLDRQVWAMFQSDWTMAIAEDEPADSADEPVVHRATETSVTTVARLGQGFFRRAVLANFEQACCVTGIAEPSLLIASHIVPWAKDAAIRLNPRNGLALSATLDRAFDAGLISVSQRRTVIVSRRLSDHTGPATSSYFHALAGRALAVPRKLDLDDGLLARHRDWATSQHPYG
ncbi:HNH endonuclease [Sandarakinorhabdus sp.]|uniref:HNH endonuclease n=1 Tax=Sandarakinorhabdus sp. TaxID=1916663 RepID=UPI00286DFF02|nr:HNH endonuclease [Sandarakinorhabdus sp.]